METLLFKVTALIASVFGPTGDKRKETIPQGTVVEAGAWLRPLTDPKLPNKRKLVAVAGVPITVERWIDNGDVAMFSQEPGASEAVALPGDITFKLRLADGTIKTFSNDKTMTFPEILG